MYLELNAVFGNDGARKEFDYEFTLEDELIASPVHVCGSVYNKTGIVTLDAFADYTLCAECARCTAQINRSVSVPVKHCLITRSENEENDYYIVVDNLHLDLDALVSEDIYLAMPSRFLCKDDCKGLCGICGANLNETVCGCVKPADPRWDDLKKYF